MLAELFHVSKNLVKSGQEQALVHVDFGEPGLSTKTNLKLLLGQDGTIVELDELAQNDKETLWILKKGNFNFFPTVRMRHPLLSIDPGSPEWAMFKKPSVEILQSELAARRADLVGVNLKAEIAQAKRILKWSHKDYETLEILKAFATRFLTLTDNAKGFAESLASAISVALTRAQNDKVLKSYQALMCGQLQETKNKAPRVACNVQIILDYLPKGALTGVLYTPRIRRVVIECLDNEQSPPSEKTRNRGKTATSIECSFEGKIQPLLSGPFTDWSATPIIGKPFKPFSKFSEARCNFRYGKADVEGFAIGFETAKSLVVAGSFITAPENFGKTWTSIRNGRFEKKKGNKSGLSDVLIAYPSYDWGDIAPVSIIVRQTKDNIPDEDDEDDAPSKPRSFTREAERFCKALKEVVRPEDLQKQFIRLLILRQISQGQVQIAYTDTPSRGHFAAAVEQWVQSGNNLPPRLKVPLPSNRQEVGFQWFKPKPLFPEEAIRVFSHQWIRDGTECFRVQSPPISDVFDVFLRKEGVWQTTARRLLETLVPRIEPLLICAGTLFPRLRSRCDPNAWRNFIAKNADSRPDKGKPNPRYCVAQSISLMGSLLHAINSIPETYMKETAFLLGKLLAMMDELHRCYCVVNGTTLSLRP